MSDEHEHFPPTRPGLGGAPLVLVAANARLGSYRLVRILGEGGMGVVWEAEHTGLQKRVALKTLRAEVLTEPSVVERFLREGKTASKFRHPNVVDITDVGQADGVPYLVMEFLEGESLASRLERGPALSLRETADIFIPVFAALQDAHNAGIVHRDIKPDNIFLARSADGHIRPVVLDFGIAKIAIERVEGGITRTATFLGTPYYVSPEQASDAKTVDARSDQYALGVSLYESLSLKKPFDSQTLIGIIHSIALGDYTPLSEHRPDLPPPIIDAVHRAMHKNANARFASVHDLGSVFIKHASTRIRAYYGPSFAWTEETRVVSVVTLEDPAVAALETAVNPLSDTLRDRHLSGKPAASSRSWRYGAALAAVAALVVLVIWKFSTSPNEPPPSAISPDPVSTPVVRPSLPAAGPAPSQASNDVILPSRVPDAGSVPDATALAPQPLITHPPTAPQTIREPQPSRSKTPRRPPPIVPQDEPPREISRTPSNQGIIID